MSPWQQYADICCWDEVVILLKLTLMSAFLMKMRTCCFILKRKENREKKSQKLVYRFKEKIQKTGRNRRMENKDD